MPTPGLGDTAPYNLDPVGLPSFFSWDSINGITIQGLDFAESWSYYIFEITATDLNNKAFNNEFQLEVTTMADCSSASMVTDAPVEDSMTYEIGSPTVTTVLPSVIDLISEATQMPLLCGPISYMLYETNSAGTVQNGLPKFATFTGSTRKLDINTSDISLAGTYYLLLDIFYTEFSGPLFPNAYHFTKIIEVTLNVKAVVQQVNV